MRTIFFCGHKSAYGLGHLVPLLTSNFKIEAVVLATEKRWELFREKLSGKNYYPQVPSLMEQSNQVTKKLIKKIIPECIIQKLKRDPKKPTDVHTIAEKYAVPIWYTDNVNSEEFIERIRKTHVDLIISAAYPQIFSKKLISTPTRGAINSHPSLLPKFRGAHPHYWSIVKGEEKSGLTAHFMTENIDDGDIIAQIEYPISDYNYNELYERIIKEIRNLVEKVEEFFLKENQSSIPQNSFDASYFREPREIHNRIFWGIYSAKDIFNLVRGQKAFTFFRNEKVVIRDCYITISNRNLTNEIEVESGTIIDLGEKSIAIKTNDGVVNVTKTYMCNKLLRAHDFIRRYKVLVGEKLD